eukprot:CAMPEP_0116025924 /NCGR_PEP_ID=MMETSP0321-20121206/13447_1 /TAXON_ID=163516 /ORGANISM="Leptocylindrus danicus var. danicus, Strain B650" /LENGTH=204 /DNA_ID=CAMNT_0003498429 /DNA_START=110 /DNA_END=724 /DNA_ORIENTATION=+
MINPDADTAQIVTEQESGISSRATSSGSVASSLCLDSSARFSRCNPLTLRRPDPRRSSMANTTAGSKRERSSSASSSNGGDGVDLSRMEEQNPNPTTASNKRLRLLPTNSSTLRRNISSGASTLSRLIGTSKNATFHDFRSHHHHSASRFGGYAASSSSAMMNSSFGVLSLKRPRSLHVSVHSGVHGGAGVGGVGCMKNSSFSK